MKSWEIIEEGRDNYGDTYDREEYGRDMGMRGGEAERAYRQGYEEGCRHGYEKAFKEISEKMHGGMGFRTEYGDRSGDSYGRMGERRPSDMPEPMEMGERRRRSNGRFY